LLSKGKPARATDTLRAKPRRNSLQMSQETSMTRAMQAMAAALLASTMLAVPGGQAQTQAPSRQAPSGDATRSAPAIPDEKLDAAAIAITKVNTLTKDYKRQFESAPPDQRERIVNEADAALEEAVTQSGLTVEEYNEIIDVAMNDPTTQSKILQRLKTMPDDE
jgi:hypothetical protein